MAIMPHKDVNQALQLALSLDVPFWPQLPRLSYYEDMYVQASEHFPGTVLDFQKRTVRFSMEKFIREFEEAMSHFDDPGYFDITEAYSAVYHRFLELDLSDRPTKRGQLEGPISFGFHVLDQDDRPILFHETIRPFMIEFLAKRVNVQLNRLKALNPNAFMFVDEPGLQFLFSGMSGYADVAAKGDMEAFFSLIERPRGVHLCGNPDWDFLLSLDLDILSLDVYSNGDVFIAYAQSIRRFLDRGGTIVWGIVPTSLEPFENEDLDSLEKRLTKLWGLLSDEGIDPQLLFSRSMLSPATCCLVNPDEGKTVEKAFDLIRRLSLRLLERHGSSHPGREYGSGKA
jgi:hypothetical protein